MSMLINLFFLTFMMYPIILILLSLKLFYIKIYIYHPVNQMIMLMMFIISISIYLYFINENSIYSLIMLITFISGVLVVFSYFTALNNEPMMNLLSTINIFTMITIIILTNMYLLINNNFIYYNLFDQSFSNNNNIDEIFDESKLYTYSLFFSSLIIILYMSIKICLTKNRPLRSHL